MTEEEWLGGIDPTTLFQFARGSGASARKLRLWMCACGSRVRHLLDNPFSREALEVAERFADDLATTSELDSAEWAAGQAASAGSLVRRSAAGAAVRAAGAPGSECATLASYALAGADYENLEPHAVESADLLRHIVGNPFRPYPAPPSWPAGVVRLAEVVYQGADAAFALTDALLEAGHPELAEHFRQEQAHPKGCWVMDLLTGRE